MTGVQRFGAGPGHYDRAMSTTPESGTGTFSRPSCPGCGEPWLRPTQLPGRFRCVNCLQRYGLVSQCPDCGTHQTIVRMSVDQDLRCQECGTSMLSVI
jgi:ribosomal protein S27E